MANWTTADYFDPFPGIRTGQAERAARVGEQQFGIQEKRIRDIEELRNAERIAQEERLAQQYATSLAQQQAAQRRLEAAAQAAQEWRSSFGIGRGGGDIPEGVGPYGIAAWRQGRQMFDEQKLKSDALRAQEEARNNPDLNAYPIKDPQGNIVGYRMGNTVKPNPSPSIEMGSDRDFMGRITRTYPVSGYDRTTGTQLWTRDPHNGVVRGPGEAAVQGGTIVVPGGTNAAPANAIEYEIDPTTGKLRRKRTAP